MMTRFSAGHVVRALVLASLLAGVAHAAQLAPTLPGRPPASRVGEPAGIVQLQARLDALAAGRGADCDTIYLESKAQAWLNFERYAAQNAAPAVVVMAAGRNAADILDGLESHGPVSLLTPELPKARHVREDLWRSVAAVKVDGRRCGAPKMTAFCEVQLAWAGYEAGDGGWRHTDPYVRIAEDYCVTASAAIAMPVVGPVAVGQPAVELTAAAPEFASVESFREDIDVSIFVLFPHDRSGRDDIRAPGRAQLEQLAAHLKTLPPNTTVAVMGHADITGKAPYNQALSARRAETVAAELGALGIEGSRIRVGAAGSTEPIVTCARDASKPKDPRYLACLEPNRRVVVHLVGDTDEPLSADVDAAAH